MTPILADISTGEWVMMAATVGMFVVALIGIIKRTEVSVTPQPFTVDFAKKFADKHEFDSEVSENRKMHVEFAEKIRLLEADSLKAMQRLSMEWRAWADGKFEELVKSNDAGRGQLHEKINRSEKSVSRLEATTEIQSQQLAAIQSDIKRLLERRP